MSDQPPEDLEWDIEDRDARVASGELLRDRPDPTDVLVPEDE